MDVIELRPEQSRRASAAADGTDEQHAETEKRIKTTSGQLIRRGEKKWLVRVFLGRDSDTGKRHYHNHIVTGTKKDAQRYLNAALRSRDLGTLVEPARMTFGAYLKRWLETAAKPRVRARTFEDYEGLLKRYVLPALGGRRLDLIRPLDLQKLYRDMQERGLTGRTVHVTHNVVRSALKQAVRWRLLPVNPALEVDLPKWEKREMLALTAEEAGRFARAAEATPRGLVFLLTLTAGLRPSEVLGLTWEDCDLDRGTVVVRRSLTRLLTGEWSLTEPKTPKSRRTVPLPATLLSKLRAHRKQQAEEKMLLGPEYESHGLVFATKSGAPLIQNNLSRREMKDALKAAGLSEKLRWYDLRHTCATLLLAAGENPKVVAERLGHSTVTLTLDTYGHVLPGMQERATERLEALLFAPQDR